MFYNGDFETPGIVFSSWSGGKDSALAFYKAKQYFRRVDYIFTMFDETCKRTRSHGLKKQIIETQAKSMGVKFLCGCAGWENKVAGSNPAPATSFIQAGLYARLLFFFMYIPTKKAVF
jgi:hypothetical protein